MLINALIYTLECGFDALIQSTGNIKNNQIGFSLIQFMLLPVAYMLYSHGASVYSITIVNIILSVCVILFHCYILQKQTNFTYLEYFSCTIYPAIKVFIVIVGLIILLRYVIKIDNIIVSVLLKSIMAVSSMSFSICYIGLNKIERGLYHKGIQKDEW